MTRPDEVADVLEDHILGLTRDDDRHDVEEQRSPRLVARALLMSRLRERLTGKTRAEHVVLRDSCSDLISVELISISIGLDSCQLSDVGTHAAWRIGERRGVHAAAIRVQLCREHTFAAKRG